ncbi:lipocalin family protein [Candidatus Latescibacterota bacterium]
MRRNVFTLLSFLLLAIFLFVQCSDDDVTNDNGGSDTTHPIVGTWKFSLSGGGEYDEENNEQVNVYNYHISYTFSNDGKVLMNNTVTNYETGELIEEEDFTGSYSGSYSVENDSLFLVFTEGEEIGETIISTYFIDENTNTLTLYYEEVGGFFIFQNDQLNNSDNTHPIVGTWQGNTIDSEDTIPSIFIFKKNGSLQIEFGELKGFYGYYSINNNEIFIIYSDDTGDDESFRGEYTIETNVLKMDVEGDYENDIKINLNKI